MHHLHRNAIQFAKTYLLALDRGVDTTDAAEALDRTIKTLAAQVNRHTKEVRSEILGAAIARLRN